MKILHNKPINILHDPRYINKRSEVGIEALRQDLVEYRFWEPIEDINSAIRSINLSHKQIIKWAKDKELEEVCVWEDDCMFPAKDGWDRFLKLKPKEYDLYLGGAYGLNKVAWGRVRKEQGIVEVHNFVGLHCYFCHSRYYDKFLSVPDDQHIDTIQAGLGKFYLCYPMVALQRPGFSANNKAVVNYNSSLEEEDIYRG